MRSVGECQAVGDESSGDGLPVGSVGFVDFDVHVGERGSEFEECHRCDEVAGAGSSQEVDREVRGDCKAGGAESGEDHEVGRAVGETHKAWSADGSAWSGLER